jgi:3-carboxy-cis,cis-muconate cycloisomerase
LTPDPNGGLYGPLFGDPDVARHFSPAASLQAMLDVEAGLADVQAALGLVPASCVDAIAQAADATAYDHAAIAAEAAAAGNLAIPLVAHLRARVAAIDASASTWVHWGVTSQDVIDTALVLQLRASAGPLGSSLERAGRAAARLARAHAGTPMPGRTWLQQAVPITFGVKAVGWLDALDRSRRRLDGALGEACVLQLGGAGGTLAALGSSGPQVAERLAARLDLRYPDLPWHAHRDRLAAYACALGVACGTLGKIARDVGLLAQTEVGEVALDPARAGGSSSMPQKQNPVPAAVALAAAVRVPGLVASVLAGMPQEHERGLGGWQAEWTTVPEIVLAVSGAARAVADILDGLRVDPDRMRANLESSGGVLLSEAVVMVLAPRIGRDEAHRLVGAAAHRARTDGVSLAEALLAEPGVATSAPGDVLMRALSPDGYIETASDLVRRALARLDPPA